jgi:6-phosphofructokinase 1
MLKNLIFNFSIVMKRIGVLCGGGHVSTFHAGMLGILDRARDLEYEVIGFYDGYKGLEIGEYRRLDFGDIEEHKAGSIIRTSRSHADPERVKDTMKKLGVDAIIVMGGNDHLGEAAKLYEEDIPVVGWPKTMDNDLSETYFCSGFITAASIASNIVRNAYADAQTSRRIHLITVFGRNTDWVPWAAARWGRSDLVFPGEHGYDIEYLAEKVARVYDRYHDAVVVSEGLKVREMKDYIQPKEYDPHGNPKLDPNKLAVVLKDMFKKVLGNGYPVSIESVTYVMRNSPPVENDRIFAFEAGEKCVDLIQDGNFGQCAIFRLENSNVIVGSAPLEKVSQQRFLKGMGFIDYENLVPTEESYRYYQPALGEPPRKREILLRM